MSTYSSMNCFILSRRELMSRGVSKGMRKDFSTGRPALGSPNGNVMRVVATFLNATWTASTPTLVLIEIPWLPQNPPSDPSSKAAFSSSVAKKVLLDADLAALYEVETKVLNQAVRRNRERFPEDFLFQLSNEEAETLRSQIVTSNESRSGRRYRPYAFTEQGIAMLSSVLRSKRAIAVNIAIMRTFVRLRQILASHEELARRLEELEWRQSEQGQKIESVFEAIQHLIEAPADEPEKRRIGFPTNQATPIVGSEDANTEDRA